MPLPEQLLPHPTLTTSGTGFGPCRLFLSLPIPSCPPGSAGILPACGLEARTPGPPLQGPISSLHRVSPVLSGSKPVLSRAEGGRGGYPRPALPRCPNGNPPRPLHSQLVLLCCVRKRIGSVFSIIFSRQCGPINEPLGIRVPEHLFIKNDPSQVVCKGSPYTCPPTGVADSMNKFYPEKNRMSTEIYGIEKDDCL